MECPTCGYSKMEPNEYNPKGKHSLIDEKEDAKKSFHYLFTRDGDPNIECPLCGAMFRR